MEVHAKSPFEVAAATLDAHPGDDAAWDAHPGADASSDARPIQGEGRRVRTNTPTTQGMYNR